MFGISEERLNEVLAQVAERINSLEDLHKSDIKKLNEGMVLVEQKIQEPEITREDLASIGEQVSNNKDNIAVLYESVTQLINLLQEIGEERGFIEKPEPKSPTEKVDEVKKKVSMVEVGKSKMKEPGFANENIAYCFKCQEKREMKNPTNQTGKGGRLIRHGICPECGAKMARTVPRLTKNEDTE